MFMSMSVRTTHTRILTYILIYIYINAYVYTKLQNLTYIFHCMRI